MADLLSSWLNWWTSCTLALLGQKSSAHQDRDKKVQESIDLIESRKIDGDWVFFKKLDITVKNPNTDILDLYLRRWVLIRTPWFQVMLHKIVRADADKDLHNHPWSFRSLILFGGYEEEIDTHGTLMKWRLYRGNLIPSTRLARPGKIVGHNIHGFHRIARLLKNKPCWTLVFTGPKRQSWSFLTLDGKVIPWRDYIRAKGHPLNEDLGDDW